MSRYAINHAATIVAAHLTLLTAVAVGVGLTI